MGQHWQEILPIDQYYVRANGLLHDYDRKVIALLYQPLIGAVAHSLYMTWWAEIENNELWSSNETHHHLMSMLDLSLNHIFEAREKLEAIGLVKTYEKNEDNHRVVIYEIQPPIQPDVFFKDGLLSIFLFKKLGAKKYNRLKEYFIERPTTNLNEYHNVTKSFTDVFKSIGSLEADAHLRNEETFIGRQSNQPIHVDQSEFNFDLLETGLARAIFPRQALTEEVREVIHTLHFLYGIDPLTLQGHLLDALDEKMTIDLVQLRKSVRDWYTLVNNNELPSLIYQKQQVKFDEDILEVQLTDNEREYVRTLESLSPFEFLSAKMGGAKPSESEIKAIEDIMVNQKLPVSVINVLIDYVLQKNNNRLPKNYLEAIASTWAKNKITSASQAFIHLKTEKETQKVNAETREKKSYTTRKKVIRKEVVPSFMKEQDDATSVKPLDEAEKQRLKDALKNLNMSKGSKE